MDDLVLAGLLLLVVGVFVWLVSRSSTAQPGAEGSPRRSTEAELRGRAAGIAFLLREARRSELWTAIHPAQRIELIERYEQELEEINARLGRGPAKVPSAIAEGRPAQAPAPARAPTSPQRAPPKPMDWSWLAEQQANLFLFAGAFLVVVAALIYVGYSGQAVTGALKVALLAGYTLAFLTAGVVCVGKPIVKVAGLVFIAISAVLVPLNFVLAGSVIEADFSDEGMWLAGSLTAAVFYAAVGGLGLGRQYGFASGGALISGAGAGAAVLGLHAEWVPLVFLGLAVLMALAEVFSPEPFRMRVSGLWIWQANAVAPLALAYGLGVAIGLESDGEEFADVSRWFPAPAAALGLAFYGIRAARASELALIGCAATLAGLTSSLVYGTDISPEYYAFALIGAGALMMAVSRSPLPDRAAALLHRGARIDAIVLAHVATAAGVAVAVIAAVAAADPDAVYAPETRWFLLGAFAGAAAVYATHLSFPTAAPGAGDTFGLAVAGMCASVVYGADWNPEYYSFAAVAAAALLLGLATAGLPRGSGTRNDWLFLAHVAAATGATVAVGAVYFAAREGATYEPETLWFLPALFACLVAFYALALLSPFRPAQEARIAAGTGLVASVFGVTTGIVYALEVSEEYYAFAALGPAVALGALAHVPAARSIEDRLPGAWREGAVASGWLATVAGLSVAVIAALVPAFPESSFEPDTRIFLPLAFLAGAAFFALDASRGKRWGASSALLAALGAAGVTVCYALDLDAEYYGVALASMGLAYGFGGRVWSPSWLDGVARDQVAAGAATLGWLPFEGVYEDHLRIGAGTHLAAALFYSGAAIVDRSKLTLDKFLDVPERLSIRVGSGWLYLAGLTVVIGYVDILRSLPGAEGEEEGSLALPLMGLSLGFVVAAALLRWVRPDFRAHVYVIALLTGLVSLSMAPDSLTLALILSVFVAAYVAAAALEDSPLLAAPAVVFAFGAVVAWREEGDWPVYSVPLAYSSMALVAYGVGFWLRRWRRGWGDALRAAGAAFAVASPGVGFGILAANTEGGNIDGEPFETSALYEWSTLATGVVGLLALAEASIARRGWIVVAGSAVVLVAVLLQIGRFHPDNVQAYTAVIGTYLVLLGLIGLSRYRLVPGLDETAVYVEALGAATIMFPSFLQSIEGGWRYELILLVEAAGFFVAGVALQRRGLLGTSLVALVLVAGRVLFDALNAMPNWIVALIIGMALMFVGFGILVGRERWTKWEERVLSWWGEAGQGGPGKGQGPTRLRPGAPGA